MCHYIGYLRGQHRYTIGTIKPRSGGAHLVGARRRCTIGVRAAESSRPRQPERGRRCGRRRWRRGGRSRRLTLPCGALRALRYRTGGTKAWLGSLEAHARTRLGDSRYHFARLATHVREMVAGPRSDDVPHVGITRTAGRACQRDDEIAYVMFVDARRCTLRRVRYHTPLAKPTRTRSRRSVRSRALRAILKRQALHEHNECRLGRRLGLDVHGNGNGNTL